MTTPESESQKVEGYIIMEGDSGYLTINYILDAENPIKNLNWDYDKKDFKEARVFSRDFIEEIKDSIRHDKKKWGKIPTHAIPAVWSESGGVVLTGEKIPFDQIPPLEEK